MPFKLVARHLQMPAVRGSSAVRGHSSTCMSPGTSSTRSQSWPRCQASKAAHCSPQTSDAMEMAAIGRQLSTGPLAEPLSLTYLVRFSELGQQRPGPCCKFAVICRLRPTRALLTRPPHPIRSAIWTHSKVVPSLPAVDIPKQASSAVGGRQVAAQTPPRKFPYLKARHTDPRQPSCAGGERQVAVRTPPQCSPYPKAARHASSQSRCHL